MYKTVKKLVYFITFAMFITYTYGYKNADEAIKALKSQKNSEVIKACKYLGDEEEKKGIDGLIEVMKTHKNSKVRISAISALSKMDEKGKPTTELKNVIMKDSDNTVVYAALIAIYNLKDFENKAAKEALDYCDQNKKNDRYITDIVQRIKKVLKE